MNKVRKELSWHGGHTLVVFQTLGETQIAIVVTRSGHDDYQVAVECSGFAGQAKDMFVEEAFKAALDECLSRMAGGVSA